jgi:2-polyprenyl-3-methyl-5-hydroxy-6-metoxy-1,4-benzoquinol methylase
MGTMTENHRDISDYYAQTLSRSTGWATPYPNPQQARRWAKICEFLSQIPAPRRHGAGQRLRILDVGCGNGWLTYLANVYGRCDGVDPSPGSIEIAQGHFPAPTFYEGTAADVLRAPGFEPYDVVIASEVIEHIVDKDNFVADLRKCLVPKGSVIVTTPRGEWQRKYERSRPHGHGGGQPVEAWISEKQLRLLFERSGFLPIRHDRAYSPDRKMGPLHKACAAAYKNRRVSHFLDRLGLTATHKALQHILALYQVWWFRLK